MQAHELLSCGHAPDKGEPYTDHTGATVMGWTSVLRDGKRICHACDMLRVLSCGHHPSPHSNFTTGTARTPDGREICWTCADAEQVAALLDRKPTGGYLSGDGQTVTTWTGGTLGRVTWSRPCTLSRMSYTHDRKSYRSVNVRDVHGNYWTGRGSPGVCIRLRPIKAPK